MRRKLLPLAGLLLSAGCPNDLGLSCPANTTQIGQFNLGFAGRHAAGECVAAAADGGDGGAGPLTLDDAGQTSASFCFGNSSAGPQLTLVLPGIDNVRTTGLLADGGFQFDGGTDGGTNGTNCACPVDIRETFAGGLVPVDADAGFALPPDGATPFILGVDGTVRDTLTPVDAGDPTCLCAMPCTVTYGITGTAF